MLPKIIITAALGLLLVLALAGCSNDDCAECPANTAPLGSTRGVLLLLPRAALSPMELFGYGAVTPNLDSIKVGDSLVNKGFWELSSNAMFADGHYVIIWQETGDTSTYMYHTNDLVTIRAWGQGRSSTCQLRGLHPDSSAPTIITPILDPTPVQPGIPDTVIWHRVANVSYYGIMIPWRVTVNGIEKWIFDFSYTTDTLFTVSEDMYPDSLHYFDVVVTPFNGPDPRTGLSNWTGNLLDGVMYSYGTYRVAHFTLEPIVTPGKLTPYATEACPEISEEDIVANIYDKFK